MDLRSQLVSRWRERRGRGRGGIPEKYENSVL